VELELAQLVARLDHLRRKTRRRTITSDSLPDETLPREDNVCPGPVPKTRSITSKRPRA
jgi:hypothetical protein